MKQIKYYDRVYMFRVRKVNKTEKIQGDSHRKMTG